MALKQPWASMLKPKAGMMELLRLITSSTLDTDSLRQYYSRELCNLLASLLAKSSSSRPSFKTLLSSSLLSRVQAGAVAPAVRAGGVMPPVRNPLGQSVRSAALRAPNAAIARPKTAAPVAQPPVKETEREAAKEEAREAAAKAAKVAREAAIDAARAKEAAVLNAMPPPAPRGAKVKQAGFAGFVKDLRGAVGDARAGDQLSPRPGADPGPGPVPQLNPQSKQQAPAAGAARAPKDTPGETKVDAVAFGPETHVAAAALQRSFRVKMGGKKPTKPAPQQIARPGAVAVGEYAQVLGLEGPAAAAMAKINGLLDGARVARGGQALHTPSPGGGGMVPPPAFAPHIAPPGLSPEMAKKKRDIEAQRRDLVAARQTEEEAAARRRKDDDERDQKKLAEARAKKVN